MPEEEKPEVEEEEEEVVGEGEAAEEEAKPGFFASLKTRLGKILIYSIGAILVILIAVGASCLVSTRLTKEGIREIGGEIHVQRREPYQIMELGEFTISISGDDEEPHFIRVKVSLAYQERKMELQAELGKRRIQIKDKINMIISRKTKKELGTPDGKSNLKVEIKQQINQLLQSGEIMDVYFPDITVM